LTPHGALAELDVPAKHHLYRLRGRRHRHAADRDALRQIAGISLRCGGAVNTRAPEEGPCAARFSKRLQWCCSDHDGDTGGSWASERPRDIYCGVVTSIPT
jgi:hypothetical protein